MVPLDVGQEARGGLSRGWVGVHEGFRATERFAITGRITRSVFAVRSVWRGAISQDPRVALRLLDGITTDRGSNAIE
jgi:hypothetical protein